MDHKLVYDPYMPHVSRNRLEKNTEKDLIDTLDLVLAQLSKKEDVKTFLLSLLTPTERLMLAKRLAIILLIEKGLTESQIASALHVTRVTVSRMQLFLEARGEGYELALRVLKDEKLDKEVKLALEKLAGYAVRAAGGYVKTDIFRR